MARDTEEHYSDMLEVNIPPHTLEKKRNKWNNYYARNDKVEKGKEESIFKITGFANHFKKVLNNHKLTYTTVIK